MLAAAALSTLDRRLSLLDWYFELARALGLERSIADPRIVLVTDRIDLDEQLKARSRLAAALEPCRATTGRNLLDLLATRREKGPGNGFAFASLNERADDS